MSERDADRVLEWRRLADVQDEKERVYLMVDRFQRVAGQPEEARRAEVRAMLEAIQDLQGDPLVNYVKSVLRAWARMELDVAEKVTHVYEDLRDNVRPQVEGTVPLERAAFPDLSPPQRKRLAALLPHTVAPTDAVVPVDGLIEAETA